MQLLKTVAAAVIAWVLAVNVFHLEQPFLAPWAALLTVHATVYRTLARGAQQVGAVVLGVLLAAAVGSAFGVNAATLAAAMFVALMAGALPAFRGESTTAAATALVVLATGYSDDGSVLIARLLDTAIGIGVGFLVTLAVWAPLRDRSAARHVDRIDDEIGDLLSDMGSCLAEGCDEEDVDRWIDRTRELDHEIDRAWSVVSEARESGRLNPRPGAPARARASDDFASLLRRLEQAVAEIRSMADTIAHSSDDWDPRFREPWIELLCRAGAAIGGADEPTVEQVEAELHALAAELPTDDLPAGSWPVYGALIVNLRNIVDALAEVAGAQPVKVKARSDPPTAGAKRAAQAAAFRWKLSSSLPSSVEGGSPNSHSRAIRCQLAVASSWPSTPSVRASMRRASIDSAGIVSRFISSQCSERGSPKSTSTRPA